MMRLEIVGELSVPETRFDRHQTLYFTNTKEYVLYIN